VGVNWYSSDEVIRDKVMDLISQAVPVPLR
jgi:hypothetical protein